MTRFFVSGTDTGVGKTEVSAALLSLLAERTPPPFAFKPYESGAAARGASDGERLWRAAGGWQPKQTVTVQRLRAPLAPGIAAKLEHAKPRWAQVLSTFRAFGRGPGVVEGAGGLLVPLEGRRDVVDLAAALGLPVVLVARAGLGTLNHTRLSVEALRARGLALAAVVLVQATPGRDASLRTNAPALRERLPGVRVLGPVPYLRDAKRRRAALRRALAPLVRRG